MQSPPSLLRALLIALLALCAAACGRDPAPAGGIPREKFVAANVTLRSLPDSATPEQRAASLRKHGVTERQLRAWINGNAHEPQELAKAWEEIAFKLDSLGGAPSVPHIGRPPPHVPPARPLPAVRLDTTGVRVPPPPPPGDARPGGRPARRPTIKVQ